MLGQDDHVVICNPKFEESITFVLPRKKKKTTPETSVLCPHQSREICAFKACVVLLLLTCCGDQHGHWIKEIQESINCLKEVHLL